MSEESVSKWLQRHVIEVLIALALVGFGIFYEFHGTISALEATIKESKETANGLATKDSVRADINDLKGDMRVLGKQVDGLSKDIDSIRTSLSRVQNRSAQLPYRAWLIAVKPVPSLGGGFVGKTYLIDARTGGISETNPYQATGDDDKIAIGRLWGAAKGADMNADPLDYLSVNQDDPADPTSKLWVACSFGLTVDPPTQSPGVMEKFIGPLKVLAKENLIKPENWQSLVKLFKANPELLIVSGAAPAPAAIQPRVP